MKTLLTILILAIAVPTMAQTYVAIEDTYTDRDKVRVARVTTTQTIYTAEQIKGYIEQAQTRIDKGIEDKAKWKVILADIEKANKKVKLAAE